MIATCLSDLPSHKLSWRMQLAVFSRDKSWKVLASTVAGGKANPHCNHDWPHADGATAWLDGLQPMSVDPQPAHKDDGPDQPPFDLFGQPKAILEKQLFNLPLAVEIAGHLLSHKLFESLDSLLGRFEEDPFGVSGQSQSAGQWLGFTKLQAKAAFANHSLVVTGTALEVLQ